MSTSKIDEIHIPRNDDGRYALRQEDEALVLEDSKTMKQREVCAKWGISRTKLYWLLNPDKYKTQLEKNKKNKTYDRQKANEYKKRNRAKKYAIREQTAKKG